MINITKVIYIGFLIFALSCSGNVCKYKIQYTPSDTKKQFNKNGQPLLCLTDHRNLLPQFRVYVVNKNNTETTLFTNTGFPFNSDGFVTAKNFDNCVSKKTDISKIKIDTDDYVRGRIYAYGHQDCPNQCVIYVMPAYPNANDLKISYSKKHKRLEIKIVVKPLVDLLDGEPLCVNCVCANN